MNNQIITAKEYSPIRARSFKMKTTSMDYAQYVATIKAYALAGKPGVKQFPFLISYLKLPLSPAWR